MGSAREKVDSLQAEGGGAYIDDVAPAEFEGTPTIMIFFLTPSSE